MNPFRGRAVWRLCTLHNESGTSCYTGAVNLAASQITTGGGLLAETSVDVMAACGGLNAALLESSKAQPQLPLTILTM